MGKIELAELARLQEGIYGRADVAWNWFIWGKQDHDVATGIKMIGDVAVIVCRGSVTLHDWYRDLSALPTRRLDIGWVHHGFQVGLSDVWASVKAWATVRGVTKFLFIGHSLGAARATILAAIAIKDKADVVGRVVWGEPRPGFDGIAAIINERLAGWINLSFVNRDERSHDVVTDVPFRFWRFLYRHPCELRTVTARPHVDDEWGLFAWHHMQLYAQAMVGLSY